MKKQNLSFILGASVLLILLVINTISYSTQLFIVNQKNINKEDVSNGLMDDKGLIINLYSGGDKQIEEDNETILEKEYLYECDEQLEIDEEFLEDNCECIMDYIGDCYEYECDDYFAGLKNE